MAQPQAFKMTGYQIFLIAMLAFLQFTIILDFMVISPLSAILLDELNLSTSQFGLVVSGYAWSAGISGFIAAGFVDKFDRKSALLFFYIGFIGGTFLCAMADTYITLLIARIVTGIFGGVIGSVIYAIVADIFPYQVRGRVMGFLQMAFAGAQVLGLPVGVYLATHYGWQSPFFMIVGICLVVLIFIVTYLKPVNTHLEGRTDTNSFDHLIATVSNKTYLKGFAATILLGVGGFMLMPFGSAFSVNNLGLRVEDLSLLYLITGICAMGGSPLVGLLSDKIGKYAVFCICSVMLIITVSIYCNLGVTPFWELVIFSIVMFISFSGRMVCSSALLSAVPEPKDRGAFMSINSSVSMMSGGIASLIAGMIVHQNNNTGPLFNYNVLGYVVSGATVITIGMMWVINRMVHEKLSIQATT
jgi:predicted MFS family arabinose efflux permease